MAETPPPISPTPTASQEEEQDQAAEQPATASPTQPQPVSSTEPQKDQGHIPPSSPSARDGPASPASVRDPPAAVAIPVGRVNGKFVSLKPNQPPAEPKAQPVALLNSPKSNEANEIKSGGFPEGGNIDRGISGLSDIPKGWPDLPSNASLSAEIAWVQSERLRVVKDKPSGGIAVSLSKARVPAPSMSALGWLETSIRSYAKFIEVASKQASSGQDEAEFVRKERMALGEIRAILQEMIPESKG